MATAHVATKIGAGQRTTAVPTRRQPRTLCSALGIQQTETGSPTVMTAGNQRERDRDRDQHAHRAGRTHGLEDRQPGETEAIRRARDRQAGGQDDVGDTAIGGVVRRLAIFAGVTCLVISPDEKDPVVGSRRDRERHQHIGGKRRKLDDVVHRQERDNSSGSGQFDADHGQQQGHGDERAVDEEQHHEDHHDRGRP